MSDPPDTRPLKDRPLVFTFGDPQPAIDRRDIWSYFRSDWNGRWYTPPVSFAGLSKALKANVHHESAIRTKAGILASSFIPHELLSRRDFKSLALNYLIFGNGYLERIENAFGKPIRLAPAQSKYIRLGRDGRVFQILREIGYGKEHEFELDTVLHIAAPDIDQDIYGVPEYLSVLQSAFLNENATLFRRKYYLNGSHAGFILYMSDAVNRDEDITAISEAMEKSKGIGNFKNLFLYSPGGKENGVKVIPIAEVAAKDEFLNIKNVTRDDVLAAHRVPPQLMGVVPNNTGGFGSVGNAAIVFARNEIVPLQTVFEDEINDWIGEEVVRFEPYTIAATDEKDRMSLP